MPFGWEPRAADFPRRNRLISGLALGVVVIEAARRSGSLITMRFALEQGREVFAVPGSPLDPRAEGSNNLLKEGATLVTEAADVLAVLRPILGRPLSAEEPEPPASVPPADPDMATRARVLDLLGPTPGLDRRSDQAVGRSPAVVRAVLLELELAGRLERVGGGLVALDRVGLAGAAPVRQRGAPESSDILSAPLLAAGIGEPAASPFWRRPATRTGTSI